MKALATVTFLFGYFSNVIQCKQNLITVTTHTPYVPETTTPQTSQPPNISVAMTTASTSSQVSDTTHPVEITNTDHTEISTPSQPETSQTPLPVTSQTPSPDTSQTSNPTTSQNSQPVTMTTEHHDTSAVTTMESTTEFQPETSQTPGFQTTTEPSVSTSTGTSPKPPAIPKFVLKENGTVCIVIQGNITFDIQYLKNDHTNGTAHIVLPYDAIVGGDCNYDGSNTKQKIIMSFFTQPWVLEIVVAKDGSLGSMLPGATEYGWKTVSLSYVIDSHFPDANTTGEHVQAEVFYVYGQFKASADGSYMCKARQKISYGYNDCVTMVFTDMQYRAFGTSSSAGFPKTGVAECPADNNNNNKHGGSHKTLGLALGCASAALVVVAVFAGIVWCRRKKEVVGELNKYSTIN